VLALAACTPTSGQAGSAETPGTADGPGHVVDGGAHANRAYFDATNRTVTKRLPDPHGPDFIDALIAAGFSRSDMQVTRDRTSIDLRADSIQFSVRMGSACLIGQNGVGGYHSEIAPVLATDACLVGATRPIDW
jgi:hypothetical protein